MLRSRACILALLCAQGARACTLIVAGKNATTDGSVIVAHTDDAGGGTSDLRLVRVPAMDHEEGAMRPVYEFTGGFPRLVATDRGPAYYPTGDTRKAYQPLGVIPQVQHTYAYWGQDYGLINEKQLIIGESTAPGRTAGWPNGKPSGKCMFGIDELSHVAMERCDTARCAVQTMGDLAVLHGFWSADSGDPAAPTFADSAEVLAIGDRLGEAWLFHVLTGENNEGAIWVAQRVPDDHIAALPNTMTIRNIDLDDSDNYLASPGVMDLAIKNGWYNSATDGDFDFVRAYSNPTGTSPLYPLYSGRRMWRIYQLLAPSQPLDPDLGFVPARPSYPVTIRPDNKVDPSSFFAIYRDHYEGTEFDMTKGLGAGPFGNPTRFDGPDGTQKDGGGFEREIGIFRMTFSFVAQARPALPDHVGGVVWFGYSSAHGTVYVPLYGSQDTFAASYTTEAGVQSTFDITNVATQGAWRVFSFVNNWRMLKFSYMSEDIEAAREKLQAECFAATAQAEANVVGLQPETAAQILQAVTTVQAEKVVSAWWSLASMLIAKYSDGYITTGETAETQQTPGYPFEWMEQTEWKGFPHGHWKPPAAEDPTLVMAGVRVPPTRQGLFLTWPAVVCFSLLQLACIVALVQGKCKSHRQQYASLP